MFKTVNHPPTDLTKYVGKTKPVKITYAVSYKYNGGIVVGDEWCVGFDVPLPVVPKGYELKSAGVGLDLNFRPPRATAYLVPQKQQPN